MLYNNIIIRKAEETRGVKALVVQPKTTASAYCLDYAVASIACHYCSFGCHTVSSAS